MLEITEHMPRTPKQLANINGIGKAKLAKYGEEILDIVKLYCKKNGIEKPESAEDENEPVSHKIKTNPTSKKPKQDTRQTSFDLFKSGKTIEEIALERGYTAGTIETHLLHFVNTGEIDIYSLFPSETIDPVIRFFIENGQIPTAEAKVALGDAVTYSAIRAARSYVERNNG
jgi:hypothetical protein